MEVDLESLGYKRLDFLFPERVLLGKDVGIFVAELLVILEPEVPALTVAHGSDAIQHLQDVVGRKFGRRLNVFANDIA